MGCRLRKRLFLSDRRQYLQISLTREALERKSEYKKTYVKRSNYRCKMQQLFAGNDRRISSVIRLSVSNFKNVPAYALMKEKPAKNKMAGCVSCGNKLHFTQIKHIAIYI